MDHRLAGKKVLITGASSGIGRAIAQVFAHAGAELFLTYRKAHKAIEDLRMELGGAVEVARLDLAEGMDGIGDLLDRAHAHLGRIDIVVNNAGADILTGTLAGQDREGKLQNLLAVDLQGTMQMCWKTLSIMQAQAQPHCGVILNMAWDLAMHGCPGENPQLFSAAKGGIIGFTRSLARDCGPSVRVNALAPGWICTGFAKEKMAADYRQRRLAEIPLGRFGEPEDVAAAGLFLASPAAAYISGVVLRVNGGGHLMPLR
ncbi:MAG: SDR family NAD(P)-dependent oxidoreductase, partial [Candidatus Eutrophobiaceae bacterium]